MQQHATATACRPVSAMGLVNIRVKVQEKGMGLAMRLVKVQEKGMGRVTPLRQAAGAAGAGWVQGPAGLHRRWERQIAST